jgi:hypothetical protein
MAFNPESAISGTHGQVWLNGNLVAECFGLQAKMNKIKTDVPMCGTNNGVGKKLMGWEGTGSIRFTKVNSKLLKQELDLLKTGKELVVTIVSKLADPASAGAERVSIAGATFDDITLADWESGQIGQVEKPFTFSELPVLIDGIGV